MYESKVALDSHPAALSPVGPARPNSISGKGPPTGEETAKVQHAAQDQSQLRGARFQNLAVLNTQFNEISKSIGKVSRAMDQIEARMVKISDKLVAFRKIFPPYPPGSDERVKLLNSFSGLRKQIQQLTYPPDDKGAQAIMTPAVMGKGYQESGGINLQAPGINIAVRSQSIEFGPGGLNIPEMSSEVQDEEIDEILEKIIGARRSLGIKRLGLLEDAEKLFVAKEQLGVAIPPSVDGEVTIPVPIHSESDAEDVSHKILGVLTRQKQSIADDPMVFKPFLG